MNLKDELKKAKEKLLNLKKGKNEEKEEIEKEIYSDMSVFMKEGANSIKTAVDYANNLIDYSLDSKIYGFINWCNKNKCLPIYEKFYQQKLANFIEKMAVWYELRYPDYVIRNAICSNPKNINKIIFEDNPYIKELLEEDNEVRCLDWNDFYNAKTFINTLPDYEKEYLKKPKYSKYINITTTTCLELSKKGVILNSKGFEHLTNKKIADKDIIGKNIKEVLIMLKKENIKVPHNRLELETYLYDREVYFKEELLNCVMYRIIERGGHIVGPRRAFLFAKEFGRNIDVPMRYGVSYYDPELKGFINEYLKAGGSEKLLCYENYFYKEPDIMNISIITIEEVLKKIKDDSFVKYTEEEHELHQRLVDVLSSSIDKEELEKEKVKRLRIERKLQERKK